MTIKDKALNIISELSVLPEDEIDIDDNFADIGIDSLRLVELIIQFEDKLNVRFDDSELDPGKLIAVKNILDLIGV